MARGHGPCPQPGGNLEQPAELDAPIAGHAGVGGSPLGVGRDEEVEHLTPERLAHVGDLARPVDGGYSAQA